jgi:hypothetical protein
MTSPSQSTTADLFRLIADSFATAPEGLALIVATIAREDRPELLSAAQNAGFLNHGTHQQLGLAVMPMLDSNDRESVAAALNWIEAAGCGNTALLTRALMTARSHYKELIALGADPNVAPAQAEQTPLGMRVLADDLTAFAQMIDAMPNAIPNVSRTKNLFDVALEDMTIARAEMVDYVLDRLPDTDLALRSALSIAVVRAAIRRRLPAAIQRYPRATFPTILRMIQRAGHLTVHHPTAWHALFNSDHFAIERTPLETSSGEPSEPRFLRNVLDLAHPDQAVELLRKATDEGFFLDHPCIQTNGRSYPPLHYAASRGHTELALRLIAAGADPLAPDSRGASASYVATQSGYADTALRILAYNLVETSTLESTDRQ